MKEKDQPRQYRYDAFISYRHNARDQQIACTLLRLLESLPLKNRPKLHIFRDREEFPTSSDLGNDIHKALEESEFLILICSPEYLQSKWCREELVISASFTETPIGTFCPFWPPENPRRHSRRNCLRKWWRSSARMAG